MRTFPSFAPLLLSCFALAVLSCSGCKNLVESTQALHDYLPWDSDLAESRKRDAQATRVVAIWTHDVLSTPGKGATQGFGGRLYFYNHEQDSLEVDGQVVIYAFDDTGKAAQNQSNRQPTRKFVFRADQLQSHLSDSELGPSYSFWIPWQPLGGEEKQISLVPIFIPSEGRMINGLFSKVTLPGTRQEQPQLDPRDELVQQLQQRGMRVDTFSSDSQQPQRTLNTQTINVSPNLSRHMASAQGQSQPAIYDKPASPQTQTVTQANLSGTLPTYDEYNGRRRPTGIQTTVNPSGLKSIKLGPPLRP